MDEEEQKEKTVSEQIETLVDTLLRKSKDPRHLRNLFLQSIVAILDGVEPHGSNVNNNGKNLGELTYQIECFIEEE
jgi:hypothetical protein